MRKFLKKLSFVGPLLARLAIGFIFVKSGWGKLHHLPDVVEYFTSLGIPFAKIQAPFAAGTELIAGLLLMFGLATRLMSLPLIVIMGVAIRTAKWEEATDVVAFLMLPETLIAIVLIMLIASGAGKLSLDYFLCISRSKSTLMPLALK